MTKAQHIVFIVIAIIIIILFKLQNDKLEQARADLAQIELNNKALLDTIEITKNRVGQLQYEKSVFITTQQNLENLSKELSKELIAQKGTIAFLQKIVSSIVTQHNETAVIPILNDSSSNPCDSIAAYTFPWQSDVFYDSLNFRNLSGELKFTMDHGIIVQSSSKVTQDITSFDLITGLEKKDDHYEIFVRSNYPGFSPSRISGAFIPQKDLSLLDKRKWVFGPSLNFGIGAGGISTKNIGPVVYVGAGFSVTRKWLSF